MKQMEFTEGCQMP